MFPVSEVAGVLKSAWASNQMTPMSASRDDPTTEPMAIEWSPPRTSGRAPSSMVAATRSASRVQTDSVSSRKRTPSVGAAGSGRSATGTSRVPTSVHAATDSGGAGEYRGGLGGQSAWLPHKVDGPITHLLSTFGMAVPQSLGVAGGYPGGPVLFSTIEDTDLADRFAAGRLPDLEDLPAEPAALPPKTTVALGDDDVFCAQWSGGGGYGDPLDRDPQRVAADIRDGAVSLEAAEKRYGVVLADGEVDREATDRRREELRDRRTAGGR